jgi:microcystin-dependent protein
MRALIIAIFTAVLCLSNPFVAFAADVIPKLIIYQGKLTDAAGGDLGAGQYTLRFKLFDAATAGTLVWGEQREVTVVKGVFNVILGGAGAVQVVGTAVNDLGFAFGGPNRFLETTIVAGPGIAGEHILAPRQQLMSVPYAVEAFNGVPPGTVVPFFGTEAPPGWIICAGQAVPRVGSYERLFAVIGTSCGSPSSETFNVPDLRGQFLRGADDPDGTGNEFLAAGKDPSSANRAEMMSGRSENHSIGTIQGVMTAMPQNKWVTSPAGQHDHTTHAKGTINQGYSYLTRANNAFSGAGNAGFGGRSSVDTSMRTSDAGNHTHEISGGDIETRPINVACNYIIKY